MRRGATAGMPRLRRPSGSDRGPLSRQVGRKRPAPVGAAADAESRRERGSTSVIGGLPVLMTASAQSASFMLR
ncbi:hypothetical protein ASG32_06780 [Methylobacterium sp. Leaf361]|nr:hypothetical protein ASG32_06780 [Methylobacterium sp. Leaf361]